MRQSFLVAAEVRDPCYSEKSVPAFYTLADSVIVGKTLGKDALAWFGACALLFPCYYKMMRKAAVR